MFHFSLSRGLGRYPAHEKQLDVLRFQGEEDCANSLQSRSHDWCPRNAHLKSRVLETSADGKSWREVAGEEDDK
jgi:hypothetical protein